MLDLLRKPLALLAGALLAGCTFTLVQPYDEKLFNDTEAIYKKAAGMIDDGMSASPRTDDERRAIKEPAKSAAHFSAFKPRYDALLNDSDALLMRAMAGSAKLDATGLRINQKIEELIAKELPSQCEDLDREFQNVSLTVKNYVDLKCLLLRWREQHQDPVLTDKTQILKRGNWEGRKGTIFNAVLAIQKAEGFKKEK
jgi:hypothetical protein